MNTIKGFWQHKNGKIYAIQSDTFGNITGAAGPLDPDDLRPLSEYEYKHAIVDWITDSLNKKKLRRIDLVHQVC
jgi:hypothetical protein